MRWDDPSLAGFAQRAGWEGGDVNVAVAVILATSGGDDAYGYQPPYTPGHTYVGLFGIDTGAYPQFDGSLMRNPIYNAEAAFTLWTQAGKSFKWNQAFTSGAYKHFAAEAGLATQVGSPVQYGFALGGDDLDSAGLARQAWAGNTAVGNLATVVRGL